MSYVSANNLWNGPETYLLLWSYGGHPGDNHDAVRQWRAPQAGTIHITGNASDGNVGCGDGVIVSINKNGQSLWQQTIENGNTTGFNYDLTTTVATGDQINFVINKRGDLYCDATNFNPTIAFSGSSSAQIHWLVTDQLGTPRMVFDQSGLLANMTRHDYLPFGEEVPANFRSGISGYGTDDSVRQKFTLKERDNETGLDYFLARYYSSTQGRFTSADDFLNDTHLTDPDSWNLYTYVRNNPLRFVDPLGQTIEETVDKKHKMTKDEKKAIEKDLQAKTGLSSIHFDKNGKLTYDPNEKANGGSAQLRQGITGAINDSKNVFQIGDYSGSENIQFAV